MGPLGTYDAEATGGNVAQAMEAVRRGAQRPGALPVEVHMVRGAAGTACSSPAATS